MTTAQPLESGNPIRLERATLADVALIAPLFDAYRVFYKQPSDPAGAAAFLSARLRQNSTGETESVVFLAMAGGSGAGFTQLHPSFTSVGLARTWILNDLYVAPSWRGKGVGSALLLHAMDFARTDGAKSMSLLTAHDNHAARSLYASLAWTRDEVFLRYTFRLRD
jgi:GNAT superfamily N-acetyltransferase